MAPTWPRHSPRLPQDMPEQPQSHPKTAPRWFNFCLRSHLSICHIQHTTYNLFFHFKGGGRGGDQTQTQKSKTLNPKPSTLNFKVSPCTPRDLLNWRQHGPDRAWWLSLEPVCVCVCVYAVVLLYNIQHIRHGRNQNMNQNSKEPNE